MSKLTLSTGTEIEISYGFWFWELIIDIEVDWHKCYFDKAVGFKLTRNEYEELYDWVEDNNLYSFIFKIVSLIAYCSYIFWYIKLLLDRLACLMFKINNINKLPWNQTTLHWTDGEIVVI
jgi:hypothetical protein